MSNAITTKLNSLKIEALKEMAISLVSDFQDGAEIVLEFTLSEIESRLPEADFISFCSELEAA